MRGRQRRIVLRRRRREDSEAWNLDPEWHNLRVGWSNTPDAQTSDGWWSGNCSTQNEERQREVLRGYEKPLSQALGGSRQVCCPSTLPIAGRVLR